MSKEQKRDPCFLIEINAQNQEDKLRISPIGTFTGLDGRTYTLDASPVMEKTKEQKIDIVLNVNHGYDEVREKAAGWFDFDSLEVREDGIYASLNTTNIGEEAIKEKHYRYLSPEYKVAYSENNRIVLQIVGVGLVNRPNVLDEALNEQQENEEDNTLQKTEKEIELQAQIDAEREENKQLKDAAKKTKIETAVTAGELMPNKQEFAMGLDGEQLDSFLALNKEDAKHLTANTKPDDIENNKTLTTEEVEVNKQLGLGE
jgi:hypothetical protein